MGKHIIIAGDDHGELQAQDLTLKQLFALKAASGLDLRGLLDGVERMDPTALQALVWFLKQQRGEHVAIGGIDFKLSDFKSVDVDDDGPGPDAGNVTSSETDGTAISEHSDTSSTSDPQTLTL